MTYTFNCLSWILLTASVLSCQTDGSTQEPTQTEDSVYSENNTFREMSSSADLDEELRETECAHGSDFISGTLKFGARYKAALSMKADGIKITLDLTSTATLATFKDVVVVVTFVSETGAVVIEKEMTVDEFIQPGGTVQYETEIDCTPEQYENISEGTWVVKDAICP